MLHQLEKDFLSQVHRKVIEMGRKKGGRKYQDLGALQLYTKWCGMDGCEGRREAVDN